MNKIPPNALEWLSLCLAQGPVAPPNYTKRMQRLRKRANVNYPQNAARHCFASYHIAYHQDAAQTAFLLGHPNAALLYKTYRELVSFEDSEKFWDIVPDSVLGQRDEMEKKLAESESCCGRALKDVSGKWVPIDPDPIFPDMSEIPDDWEPNAVCDGVLENV